MPRQPLNDRNGERADAETTQTERSRKEQAFTTRAARTHAEEQRSFGRAQPSRNDKLEPGKTFTRSQLDRTEKVLKKIGAIDTLADFRALKRPFESHMNEFAAAKPTVTRVGSIHPKCAGAGGQGGSASEIAR